MIDALSAVGNALAGGRALILVVREAAHAGQWAEAAARLESWAAEFEAAAEALSAAEVPLYDEGAIASVLRTAACARRLREMAIDAANVAWRKASENGVRA